MSLSIAEQAALESRMSLSSSAGRSSSSGRSSSGSSSQFSATPTSIAQLNSSTKKTSLKRKQAEVSSNTRKVQGRQKVVKEKRPMSKYTDLEIQFLKAACDSWAQYMPGIGKQFR